MAIERNRGFHKAFSGREPEARCLVILSNDWPAQKICRAHHFDPVERMQVQKVMISRQDHLRFTVQRDIEDGVTNAQWVWC